MKPMLKNIRFVILLATVILVTIVLSLRPDITSWLSTTKKIDKEAIVNDFAQEINTLLDNLPEKQIHFLDNTIYFKTLDSTRMFLGNESYNYENVKSHNSYKSFKETQNLSADDIFKRIIKNYNLNIEPNSNEISTPQDKKTETNNLSLILNANVKENRKTQISNVPKISQKNIFLSLLYNHVVDGDSKFVLTTIQDGKLRTHNRDNLLFDLINESSLKKIQSNIKSDTLFQKAFYKLLIKKDSTIDFEDLGIADAIIHKQYRPKYIYYNFRDEDLYFGDNNSKIDLNFTKNGFSINNQTDKMNEFLRLEFGLNDTLLSKFSNKLNEKERLAIRSCFNSPDNIFEDAIWKKQASVTETFAEYLRSYIYNQNQTPYAFLIYKQKLYTLKSFLNSEKQLEFKPLFLNWEKINEQLNIIYKKYKNKLNPLDSSTNKEENARLRNTESLIYLLLGLLDLLLVAYLLFFIFQKQKLNANIRKLELIKTLINIQKSSTSNELQFKNGDIVDSEEDDDNINDTHSLLQKIINCIMHTNNKIRKQKPQFKNELQHKKGDTVELEVDNSNLDDTLSHLERLIDCIIHKTSKSCSSSFETLHRSCTNSGIELIQKIAITNKTKKQKIVLSYTNVLENIYFEAYEKTKASTIDNATYNSIIKEILNYINKENTQTTLDNRINGDLITSINNISKQISHIKKIKEIINVELNDIEKQKQLFNYLNENFDVSKPNYLNNKFGELIDSLEEKKSSLKPEEKLRKIIALYDRQKLANKSTNGNNLLSEFDLIITQKKAFNTIHENIFKYFSVNDNAYDVENKIIAANQFKSEIEKLQKGFAGNFDFFNSLERLIDFVFQISKNQNKELLHERIKKLEIIESEIKNSLHLIIDTSNTNPKTPSGLENNFKNIILASDTLTKLSRLYGYDNKSSNPKNSFYNPKHYLSDYLIANSFFNLLTKGDSPESLERLDNNLEIFKTKFFGDGEVLENTKSKEDFDNLKENYKKFYTLWENDKELREKFGGIDVNQTLETFQNLKNEFETKTRDVRKLLEHHRFLSHYLKLLYDEYITVFYPKTTANDFKNISDFKTYVENEENRELLNYLFEFMLHSYYFIQNSIVPDKESMNNYRLLKNGFVIDDELSNSIKKGFRAGWLDDSNTLSNQIFYLSKILNLKELRIFISNYVIRPWDEISNNINNRKKN
jgi:hypothetical protein